MDCFSWKNRDAGDGMDANGSAIIADSHLSLSVRRQTTFRDRN
jgi:hypothetical protein